MNRVCLIGRLTKDIDLMATPSGANVASFTLAVDNYTKDAQGNIQTSFISCVAWNQQAVFLSNYCKKGYRISVEGRIQTRTYDRKDGSKAYVTEVICDRVENLSPKQETQEPEQPQVNDDNEFSFSDDDLPF